MSSTLKIWIISHLLIINTYQQLLESEWQFYQSELVDNTFPSTGWNSIPPIYTCNSIIPPYSQFYDFTAQNWVRNIDLTQQRGYFQVRIIFDLYIFQNEKDFFQSGLPFLFKFDGMMIQQNEDLLTSQNKPINFTYCNSRLFRDQKFFLDFKINIPSNTINFNHQFSIRPLELTTQFSIKNFVILLNKCPKDCLQCQQKNICEVCKPNFQLLGHSCLCQYPKPFMVNDDCLDSCPLGYYDFQDFICKPYASKQNIFLDNLNQNFIKYDYIKDIWSNNYYQSSTYEDYQNLKGPFRFNDKIKYQIQKSQINNILELDITFYFYGKIDDLSGLAFGVNQHQIGSVYLKQEQNQSIQYSLNTTRLYSKGGFVKQAIQCTQIGFSSCIKVTFYATLQSFLEQDIDLEIGSYFSISDPYQAWGIDQVTVNEIEPTAQLPLICTYWYEGNCVDHCPQFSTLNGIICEDYGSIYKNPLYILKAFYPNYLTTEYVRSIVNATSNSLFQFENRILYLFNTEIQGGILWQKLQISNPHRKLRYMISFLLIDWQSNSQDYYLELVVGSSLNQQRHKFFADSLHQFNDYQINQEFPDYVYRNFTIDINHNSKIFNLELRCFSPQNGYCSFFDYFIIIEKCDHGCSQCNLNGECLKYDFAFEDEISYQYHNYQCLDGYYYINGKCSNCQFGCGKCKSGICFQCKQGFELKEGKCYCDFLSNGGLCLKPENCPQQCQTCQKQNNYCDSCNFSQFKVLNMNTCVCMKGYFFDDNFDCIQCNQKCITCNGLESCTSCSIQANRQLIEQMCKCKQGYFDNSNDIICQQCHNLCKECYLEYDHCSECDTQIFRELSQGKCVCQIGYYEDNQQICQKCNANCYTCEQQNICLSCDLQLNRKLSNQQTCICNPLYFENEQQLCQKCHHSCLSCNQSDEFNQCTFCPSSRIKSSDTINVYECKCRQGYFDIGQLECISCKLYPNVSQPHPCYSYCGDKILQWNEQCDDGNNDSRDGCIECYFPTEKCSPSICKKCYLGDCQICNDGYYLNKNNECEKCSQSCITCIDSSNNCLQCRFVLKDQTCKMCDSQQGLTVVDDECQAICGDNKIIDNEQCDDGNLIDGDGCNSLCIVEEGYICNPICQIINPINLILASDPNDKYFNSKRQFYLEFNQDVIIDGNLSSMVNMQLNNSTIKFNSNITNLSLQQLLIQIDFLNSVENPIIQVEIITPSKIKNKQGVALLENIQTIKLISYSQQDESTQTATNNSSNFTQFIMIFLLSLAGFSFITGGLNIFFNLLDSIQLLAYLKYFNIIYPYNVQMYFQSFGFAEFDFLKEYISVQLTLLDFDFKISEYQPDQKFADEGYSAIFIVNMLSVLSVFLITFCIFVLSKLLCNICNKYMNYIHNSIDNDGYFLLNTFEYYLYLVAKHIRSLSILYNTQYQNNIIRTIMTVVMDLNMAVFLQLKFYNYNMRFSYFLSLIAFIAELQFIYYGLKVISKKRYEFITQKYKEKHESFLEGNPEIHQNQFVRYYNIIIIVKKMMFMFALIFLYNNPCFQISISSIYNIIFIVYMLLTRPLKDINEFYKVILTEFILWLEQLIIFLIFYIQAQGNQLDQSKIDTMQFLGWSIIGLSVFMLLLQFIIDIKQHSQFLYQQYNFIQQMFEFVTRIFNNKVEQTDQIAEELIKDEKIGKSRIKLISYQMARDRKVY